MVEKWHICYIAVPYRQANENTSHRRQAISGRARDGRSAAPDLVMNFPFFDTSAILMQIRGALRARVCFLQQEKRGDKRWSGDGIADE